MKKNIAIIILSVCLAAVTVIAAVMGVTLYHTRKQQHEAVRNAERVWDDYMSWCDMAGCDPRYEQSFYHDGPYASEVIRCVYIESFDKSIPKTPLPENERYCPSGNYVYDIYIYGDGSGYLHYQQRGQIDTVEVSYEEWGGELHESTSIIDFRSVLFAETTVQLTAEEIDSIFAVMEQHDYENIPTTNPHMYTGMDGDTTFLVYSSSLSDDHADWKGHMISAFCAEEGDPCYDIRKAIEALIIAHNAGPVPEKILP